MIPFRKIAILDVQSLLAPCSPNDGQKSLAQKVREWGDKALIHGMEACYLRSYDAEKNDTDTILEILSGMPVFVILPFALNHINSSVRGLHFREKDEIKILPSHRDKLLFGKSCHSLDSVKEAELQGLNYVFFSPVFETLTHPEARGVGLKVLHKICRSTTLPVFALGGINETNYKQCLDVGAFGIAAISMFTK